MRKEGGRCSLCWIWGSSSAGEPQIQHILHLTRNGDVVPLQLMEEYSRDIHAAVKGLLEGSCNPWSVHAGAGSWQKLWPVGDP